MLKKLTTTRLRIIEVLLLAMLLGTLATALHGYLYAESDQLEQLPLIRRYLDPSFATGDYSVDAMSNFSPRYYFVAFMGRLAKVVPLDVLYLLLTCLQHAGIAAVTFFAARKLFKSSDLPALIAMVLVMVLGSIELGGAAHLVASYMLPRSLMLFLALWCVWEGINLRPARSAMLAMVGSFIHPQVALQAAAISFGTIGVSLYFKVADVSSIERDQSRKQWLWWLGAGTAFGLFNFVFWFLPLRGQSLSRESLDYLIRFRAPHVHLPSMYAIEQYIGMLLFVIAGVLLWKMWYDDPATDRPLARRFGIAASLVLAFLLCGYIFVEWIPLGPFLSAQAFRAVSFVKWFALLLLGGVIAKLITDSRPAGAWFMASAFGQSQPAIVFVGTLLEYLKQKWSTSLSNSSYRLLFILALLAQLSLLAVYRGGREALALIVVFSVVLLFVFVKHSLLRNSAAIVGTIAVFCVLLASINALKLPIPRSITSRIVEPKTPNEVAIEGIAKFAQTHTPRGSIFLTPPDFGRFRLASERALLVDFKMFPFSERDIHEWRARMNAAYGPITGAGWTALESMQENYKKISDSKIRELAGSYNLSYVVLPSETPTNLLTLFSNETYKLAKIE